MEYPFEQIKLKYLIKRQFKLSKDFLYHWLSYIHSLYILHLLLTHQTIIFIPNINNITNMIAVKVNKQHIHNFIDVFNFSNLLVFVQQKMEMSQDVWLSLIQVVILIIKINLKRLCFKILILLNHQLIHNMNNRKIKFQIYIHHPFKYVYCILHLSIYFNQYGIRLHHNSHGQ